MAHESVDLIITDLDDTLWKWCKTWHAGYRGFNTVLTANGLSQKDADDSWARMYERTEGESIEFPPNPGDIVHETKLSTQDAIRVYRAALTASRAARDEAFTLFDGVRETLDTLKARGIKVVAHTDAPITAAQYRLYHAGLDGAVEELYARPVFEDFGDSLELMDTVISHVSNWTSKPDTTVLREIIRYHEVDPARTLYVGDSKRRDMGMATVAGCIPVWAAYGVDYAERDPAIADLVRVQSRKPFPPDASLANEPNANGHIYLEAFPDLLSVLDELPEVQRGGF